ncbi:hypothetical protein L226DRAFT_311663 [Lentinus tigrinus ALCF2SS1-7]|nr:hypothetical protein L226DRAFT_311663 [Lentinus tigrinus ALCF2SS1-7]
MNCFKRNDSHETNQLVDGIVDKTVTILKTGRDAVNAAPVPGLTAAVDLLVVILEKVKAARTNREEARILCERMRILSEAIIAAGNAISSGLRKFKKDSLGREELEKGLATSPELADRVDELQRELKGIRDSASQLHVNRSFLGRWWNSGKDADTLKTLLQAIEVAKEKFQLPGQITIEAHVNKIVVVVEGIQRTAEEERIRAEQDQVFDRIPRADEAHYLSAANAPKARFQQGTRERIFGVLDTWVEGQTAEKAAEPVCVLVGEAGTGKSTIASEFSKRLEEHGHLGASFFFTRGVQELNSPRKFFCTIASQLARSQSALRIPVIDAAREHLKTASLQQLDHEFQDLILKPISTLPESHPPFFVVVDALDECTEEGQELVPILLRLFLSCATRPGSPLRVFLTSRPVPHYIHDVFTATDLKPRITTLSIQDFRDTVNKDIETLIRGRLSSRETSKQWSETPGREVLSTLVRRSDGLFIYARTAVDFILGEPGDSELQMQERYDDLLKGDGAVGLTALETLYRTVLDSVFPGSDRHDAAQERLKRVLGYLVALQAPKGISPVTLEGLTGMRVGESVPILNKLRSVVFFERDKASSRFRIIHATFREFLTNPSHSVNGSFVNAEQVHRGLAEDCMRTARSFVDEHWGNSTGTSPLLRLLTEDLPPVGDYSHVDYVVRYIDDHHKFRTSSNHYPADQSFCIPVVQFVFLRRLPNAWAMICSVLAYLQHFGTLLPIQRRLIDILHLRCTPWKDPLRDAFINNNMHALLVEMVYIIIDVQAIGLASTGDPPASITEEDVEKLESALKKAEASSYNDDFDIFREAHLELHKAIMTAGIAPDHECKDWEHLFLDADPLQAFYPGFNTLLPASDPHSDGDI